jgi:putative membrane protein
MTTDVKATDVLANERTFLAYVRTALAFIAFGFVVARFGLFVEQLSSFTHVRVAGPHYSTGFGVVMDVVGVLIGALGAWRYAMADKALRSGIVKSLPRAGGYIISLLVAAIGLMVALYLAAYY